LIRSQLSAHYKHCKHHLQSSSGKRYQGFVVPAIIIIIIIIMPAVDDSSASPFGPLQAELARMRRSTLSSAIDDVDQIIELLTAAREQVAQGKTDC
jgi:hypothetical protein